MSSRSGSQSDPLGRGARHDVLLKVMLLDDETKSFTYDRRATAEGAIDQVLTKMLDLDEKEYFSLYYLDNNHRLFLDPAKPIKKQMPDPAASQWDLFFGVKFYVLDPTLLKRDTSRYYYMLQVCNDIRENRILVDGDDASMLASLLLQANVGDYDEAEHKAGYSLDFVKLLYTTTDHLPTRYEFSLIELHKQHRGLTPDKADEKFLMLAKDLRRYGQHLFAVYDHNGGVIHLGVSAAGIALHRSNKQIEQYVWPNIVKVSYRKRRFRIKYRLARQDNTASDDASNAVHLNELRCGEPPASKKIWKACVEQHTFFRLSRPELPPRRPSFLLRRGSRFRYSGGRVLEQMKQANYGNKEREIVRSLSARYGKGADQKQRTNVHRYTITKSTSEDRWMINDAPHNIYAMAVEKEVKRRQFDSSLNQQKVFALLQLEGAETPLLTSQTKFVVRRSDVTGRYEVEPVSAQSASTAGNVLTLEPASMGSRQDDAPPSEEVVTVDMTDGRVESAPEVKFEEDLGVTSTTKSDAYRLSSTFQSPSPDGEKPQQLPVVTRSYSETEDITPEINKLDEVMSAFSNEIASDSSLAATVVTAFLQREHALVMKNSQTD